MVDMNIKTRKYYKRYLRKVCFFIIETHELIIEHLRDQNRK